MEQRKRERVHHSLNEAKSSWLHQLPKASTTNTNRSTVCTSMYLKLSKPKLKGLNSIIGDGLKNQPGDAIATAANTIDSSFGDRRDKKNCDYQRPA